MAHSYRSFYVHVIFHVKNRHILTEDVPILHAYMRAVLEDAGCTSILVGGIEDHIHILAEFPPDGVGKSIGKAKTTSTRWLKKRNPDAYKTFAWQHGSGQFTVSYSVTSKVRRYIETQREHHKKLTSKEEFIRFLHHHHIPYNEEGDLPVHQ